MDPVARINPQFPMFPQVPQEVLDFTATALKIVAVASLLFAVISQSFLFAFGGLLTGVLSLLMPRLIVAQPNNPIPYPPPAPPFVDPRIPPAPPAPPPDLNQPPPNKPKERQQPPTKQANAPTNLMDDLRRQLTLRNRPQGAQRTPSATDLRHLASALRKHDDPSVRKLHFGTPVPKKGGMQDVFAAILARRQTTPQHSSTLPAALVSPVKTRNLQPKPNPPKPLRPPGPPAPTLPRGISLAELQAAQSKKGLRKPSPMKRVNSSPQLQRGGQASKPVGKLKIAFGADLLTAIRANRKSPIVDQLVPPAAAAIPPPPVESDVPLPPPTPPRIPTPPPLPRRHSSSDLAGLEEALWAEEEVDEPDGAAPADRSDPYKTPARSSNLRDILTARRTAVRGSQHSNISEHDVSGTWSDDEGPLVPPYHLAQEESPDTTAEPAPFAQPELLNALDLDGNEVIRPNILATDLQRQLAALRHVQQTLAASPVVATPAPAQRSETLESWSSSRKEKGSDDDEPVSREETLRRRAELQKKLVLLFTPAAKR